MAQTVVSIFDYRKNVKGDIIKSYSFDTKEEAEEFAFQFNFAPQEGYAWSRGPGDVPQQLTPLRAVISGEIEKWDGGKIYLMHTIRVNHVQKRILWDKVSMFTLNEIEAKRKEFPDSPIPKAFDGMMRDADTWANPSVAFRALEKGVPTGTPLEESDVVAIESFSNDIVTYISFLPNVRIRISAVWDKVHLINKDLGKDEERWIDAYYTYLCKDCTVDTDEVDEYYAITEELWREALPEGKGMLCIGCVEKRIGRKLNSKDFPTDIPINWSNIDHGSDRLIDRMTDSGKIIWNTRTCEITDLTTGTTVKAFEDRY